MTAEGGQDHDRPGLHSIRQNKIEKRQNFRFSSRAFAVGYKAHKIKWKTLEKGLLKSFSLREIQ